MIQCQVVLVEPKVNDKLIGVMENGVVSPKKVGTPQEG